ncbi:MAG: ABC transporter permease [Candidatus Marinimicrobia bacterium]|nr:ABC transporter permease [Candidatus Neomarinimicrobiota bacterium]
MNNVFAALWHREFTIYKRQFTTMSVMPILTGVIFFFMFFLPYKSLLPESDLARVIPALVLDSLILTLLITIYETTARFYWESQRSNGMASLYEMGRFHRQPSFFIAQAIISLIKGFSHLIVVWFVLAFVTEMSFAKINFQASFLFILFGALQIVSLSKIIGLLSRNVESLSKLLYIGLLPIMMLSGLFLVKGAPLDTYSEIAFYLPPYNWMTGLDSAFLQGTIDYGYLLITLIETAFLLWFAATFFHLDGDS